MLFPALYCIIMILTTVATTNIYFIAIFAQNKDDLPTSKPLDQKTTEKSFKITQGGPASKEHPTRASCWIRIASKCSAAELFPSLDLANWFEIDDGGLSVTTYPDCERQRQAWQQTCQSDAEMDFRWPSQKEEEPLSVCRFRVSTPCGLLGNNTDWFDDTSKGGPLPSTKTACEQRQESWASSCGTSSQVEIYFRTRTGSCRYRTTGAPDSKCRIRVTTPCPILGNDNQWFDDKHKGGPMPTTRDQCERRRGSWQASCGESANVEMDFINATSLNRDTGWFDNNDRLASSVAACQMWYDKNVVYETEMEASDPDELLSSPYDNSFSFRDTDGSMVTLVPDQDRVQSCYTMTRHATKGNAAPLHFCYPALQIVGRAKAGTSFLYEVLSKHPQIRVSHQDKEYCRKGRTYFDYLAGFEAATKAAAPNQILVNACITELEMLGEQILLRHPKTLSIWLVRDVADVFWASYNFWCDQDLERNCTGGHWVKPGIHLRSPQGFHDEIIGVHNGSLVQKLIIPSEKQVTDMYSSVIQAWEKYSHSQSIHVVSNEKMKSNLRLVLRELQKDAGEQLGLDLEDHPMLEELSKLRVNTNDAKGASSAVGAEKVQDGVYQQSGYKPMFAKTGELIRSWWTECEELSRRTGWSYDCRPKQ